VVEAEYECPFSRHAAWGRRCAVADVRKDGVTRLVRPQKPHYVQLGVARLLDVPPEKST